MIREIDSRREWEQSEEWRQQMQEGHRRKWDWEGVRWIGSNKPGSRGRVVKHGDKSMIGGVGSRRLPPIIEVDKLWETQEGGFDIYPYDKEGLERELRDLERDAELMAKHEGVQFPDE